VCHDSLTIVPRELCFDHFDFECIECAILLIKCLHDSNQFDQEIRKMVPVLTFRRVRKILRLYLVTLEPFLFLSHNQKYLSTTIIICRSDMYYLNPRWVFYSLICMLISLNTTKGVSDETSYRPCRCVGGWGEH
jgi:hypothetical protein